MKQTAMKFGSQRMGLSAEGHDDRAEDHVPMEGGVAERFSTVRERLERMVRFRMDPRLVGRLDPADILQESYLEIARRAAECKALSGDISFFVWARQITWQLLLMAHRRHLSRKRDFRLEVSLDEHPNLDATSRSIVEALVDQLTTPSQALARQESLEMVRHAIDALDPIDREVLGLRHFEQLTNCEVAEVLGLSKSAASNRYVRAMKRLTEVLASDPVYRDALEAV
jgi:RNA polymerase sigma-70 factor (ECF subfamily)